MPTITNPATGQLETLFERYSREAEIDARLMANATAHPEGLDVALGIDPAKPIQIKRSPASFFNSPLSFEQWMRRPVYVVQCRTWLIAKALGVCCLRFRCLPGYRDEEAKRARQLVADMVRKERQRIPL